jgi:hypothetical protein
LREEVVSSSTDHYPACGPAALAAEAAPRSRGFWLSIVRIAVIEIVLLLALAGVSVAYLNWSSEASFAEFLAASKALGTPGAPPTPVNGRPPCNRSA